MASFATVISEFSDAENRRTYIVSGHTTVAPKLVIQKRKTASTGTGQNEDQLMVVYGTKDAANVPLESKVVFDANVRRPVNGDAAVVTAALAVFRDFVASDEFTNMVTGQGYVKP
jgi:hypothetical protein